jgi:tetratricopeptide (TPR) repeat protein
VRAVRARPLRAVRIAVLVTLAGLLLVFAVINLWAWHHLREADRLVEKQQYAAAYKHYGQCLEVWRWSFSTHLQAGRTARRAGMYGDAQEQLDQCRRLRSGSSQPSLPLALEQLLLQAQSGDIGEVEDVLWAETKKRDAEAPLILEGLARGYTRVLRLGTAMMCWRMLAEREPNNVDALLNLGWLLESSDPDASVKHYRHALEVDPQRDDVRLALAHALLRDRPDLARPHFEEVLGRQPDNAEALLGLGQVYRGSGEPERAAELLNAALQKKPGDSKTLGELGRLMVDSGRVAEGEALLRQAIAADPINVDAHYQLYLSLRQQLGREAEAAAQHALHKRIADDNTRLIQLASKDLNSTPNDANLHYEMGTIFLRNGKPGLGVRWLHSALKLDPTHQRTHQALYEHFKAIGDTEKAEQHRQALHADPSISSPSTPKSEATKR